MHILLAKPASIPNVIAFFKENLNPNSSEIYSEEFLCPLGTQAAIRRNQMILAIENGHVVGAIRFYRRKTANTISLYQFAVSSKYRGKGVLKKMLLFINDAPIVALCPIESKFNQYYQKMDWKLQEQVDGFNTWIFK